MSDSTVSAADFAIAPAVEAPVAAPPAATVPAPAAATPPAVKPPPSVDPKAFALLVRREQALQAERQKLNEEREALKATQTEAAELRRWREEQKRDPVSLFKSTLGDNWFDIALQIAQNKGHLPPEQQVAVVKEDLDRLKAEIATGNQKAAEAAKAKAQAEADEAVRRFETEVVDHLQANPDKYELITSQEAWDYVPELIREQHRRTGKILRVDEAAVMVEDWLEARIIKATQTKRLTSKLQPASAPSRTTVAQPPASARTLSNDLSSTAPTRAAPKTRTEAERVKAAFEAFDRAASKTQ